MTSMQEDESTRTADLEAIWAQITPTTEEAGLKLAVEELHASRVERRATRNGKRPMSDRAVQEDRRTRI
jgi:hypothetical protein